MSRKVLGGFAAVVAAAALWAASACGGDEEPVPLALYAGEWNEDDGGLDGTLVQDGPCLYVDSTNAPGRWFVAFGVEGTSWDEDERAVNIPGATYRVGAAVRIGGGESGVPAASIGWAIPPAESCDTTNLWVAARP